MADGHALLFILLGITAIVEPFLLIAGGVYFLSHPLMALAALTLLLAMLLFVETSARYGCW